MTFHGIGARLYDAERKSEEVPVRGCSVRKEKTTEMCGQDIKMDLKKTKRWATF